VEEEEEAERKRRKKDKKEREGRVEFSHKGSGVISFDRGS
jgi:hypothetical protein